jgi:hypothetical protein
MEPIITLPYSEWLVAEQLKKSLPASQGYSLYAPLSRQEQGVDLLVTRPRNGITRAATLQVKYSRTYPRPPGKEYRFSTWFRAFPVSDRADFFVLASLYPRIDGRGGGTKSSYWLPMLLLLRREEVGELLSSLRARSGKAVSMFYFGFNKPDRVVLTRGAPEHRDFSSCTFSARLPMLKEYLARD